MVASAVGAITTVAPNAKAQAKAFAGVGARKRLAEDALQPFRGQAGKTSCLARETQIEKPEVLKDGRERSAKREELS